jgi:hypothetical protein
MEDVIKHAPNNVLIENIEIIFKKNNENVIDTLIDLWNIDINKSLENDEELNNNTLDLKDNSKKWTNIRNICDSYDNEMQSYLQGLKKQ